MKEIGQPTFLRIIIQMQWSKTGAYLTGNSLGLFLSYFVSQQGISESVVIDANHGVYEYIYVLLSFILKALANTIALI